MKVLLNLHVCCGIVKCKSFAVSSVSGYCDDDDVVSDDHSDQEANVEALQRELEQRKQEVKRLKLEQRARQKQQLRAKERIISQQLHVRHIHTCQTLGSGASYIHRVSKKLCKFVFVTTRQISTDFDNFWQKDGKETKILRGVLIFHLT